MVGTRKYFLRLILKENIVNIKLFCRPITIDNYTKNNMNGCWFNHKIELVIIIYSRSLVKDICNPMNLKYVSKTTKSFI